MRPFNEVLREAKQGSRPAVTVNVVNPEALVNPGARNPIPKKDKPKPQVQGPELPSSAQRAKRFSQSFGTPTGANPFTGRATYIPPTELTKLPPSGKGTVDQSAYSRVTPGDLEIKRNVRTAEVPVSDTKTGRVGVRAATPEGVRNYALSQGGFARSGRNMPASEFANRRARADAIAANPNSPEYKKIEARINQEVGGRRIPRGSNTPTGRSADAAFRQSLGLDTPEGALANRAFAKDMEQLRRQTRGERDLLAAINNVDEKPSGRQGSQGRRPAVSVSQTPSQVIANTQQTQRITQTKVEPPKGHNARIRSGARQVSAPASTPAVVAAPAPTSTSSTPAKSKPAVVAAPAPTSTPAKPARVAAPKAPKAPKASTRTVAPRASTSTANAAAASAKSFRRMARVGGLFATGVTIKNVRDQALASGAGRRRADLEGLAAGIGGSLASTAAIAAATPTGPVGQAVAGTAAFQPGADFARGIVRKLAGKPGDAVTKKSVLKNIKSTYREVVPQSVRQNIPTSLKKGFTDFYNQAVPFANKLYKGYRRFERISDLTGGDKK